MTLVAAMRFQNIPTVVADMLLTEDSPNATSIFMPLLPNLSSAPIKGRSIVSTRSKVIILNGSLAVGFTGYLKEGATLFADLARRFAKATPSAAELEQALVSWNAGLHGRASVVGWLADPEPRCFTWAARAGAKVAWVTHAFDGSGAKHFEQAILRADHAGFEGNPTERELSTLMVVTKANRVLSDEMLSQSTLSNHYGHSLEIVQWTGQAFEFQNKMVSVFQDAMLKGGSVQLRPVSCRIYERNERFALIETCNFYQHKGPDGVVGDHIFLEAISAIHDSLAGVAIPSKLLDPHSPIYSFNVACRNEDTGKSGTALFTVPSEEVEVSGTAEKFEIRYKHPSTVIDHIRQTYS
jgi:hypothetical protein